MAVLLLVVMSQQHLVVARSQQGHGQEVKVTYEGVRDAHHTPKKNLMHENGSIFVE